MKALKAGLFILLALFVSWGCSNKDEPDHLLVGEWLWEQTSGGIGGWIFKPKEGQKVVVRYTKKGTFEVLRNDSLWYSGRYHLDKVKVRDEPERRVISPEGVVNHIPQRGIPWPNVVWSGEFKADRTKLSVAQHYLMNDGFGSSFSRLK
ncbi:hypothetical protein [Tellurirhabdus bombi]|uniref:hypothetical protein n=1 Tax=Tellurirhabdus bombi TaxID=2907205 RepID=UPI001F34B018|nr:hypothetical protein [Tellurirhabdus bombi]